MYSTDYSSQLAGFLAAMGMFAMFFVGLFIVIIVIHCFSMYKIFEKLNIQPAWWSLVPYYNMYLLCQDVFGNGLYFLFVFAPLVTVFGIGPIVYIIFSIIFNIRLCRAFHKDTVFIVLMCFFPTICRFILAVDNSWFEKLPDYDISKPFDIVK